MDTAFETFRAEVTERLIEAAHTERALPGGRVRPAQMRCVWPEVFHDLEERKGWEKADPCDGAPRAVPSAQAISRSEECADWIMRHVIRDADRRALGAWLMAKVGGMPLRKWVAKEGIGRNTATRRARKALSDITTALIRNNVVVLRGNGDFRMVTNPEEIGTNIGTVEEPRPAITPTVWRQPGAKPCAHDASDPVALRQVVRAIKQSNARSREIQARMTSG